MQRLVYWVVYPFLWLISKLPFWLFYKVSDAVFVLVYYIIGYRRKTVTENLYLVFPEKPSAEIKRIRKRFYRHMCDMFLEMVKSISISNKELKNRYIFTNRPEIEKIMATKKSIMLMCGHYASYEWVNALQLYGYDYRGFGVYKKVKNKYFDQMAKDIRGRFEGELIPTVHATKRIAEYQQKGILGVYAMIADQSPKQGRAKYWTEFMNITVPVFTGTEKLAKELDMAVVYLHVEKPRRGYYEATFVNITEKPLMEPPYKITNTYFRELEKQIRKAPEYYLWTHKRWKHRNTPIPENATVIKKD